MRKSAPKKDKVKRVLLDFLKSLYLKDRDGEKLTAEERSYIVQQKVLARYVYDHKEFRIFESKDKQGSAEGDVISTASVIAAISELEKDELIERCNGCYQYVPTAEELATEYPITAIASKITVRPLPHDGLAFIQVPKNYCDEICSYINSRFRANDVRAVPLGDIIMCIDVSLPSDSKFVRKKETLEARIQRCMRGFNYIDHQDDIKEGLTAIDAWAEQEQEAERQAYANANNQDNNYGGKLLNPPKRHIARRKQAKK